MASPSDILVVGGGIGGLATALSLARAGRSVRVLERAAAFGEVGAGIQLAPNATRVLDALSVLDKVLAVGVTPRRLVLADAVTAEELTYLPLEDFVERYGGPYVVLHRSDLLDILLDACRAEGVQLRTATMVEKVIDHGDGVEVIAADKTHHTGSLLIAADGLNSTVRRLFADDDQVASGYVAYRGAVPMAQVQRHADLRDVVAWIGPGLHLVQYPLRSGQMYNQVAVFRSRKWTAGEADWGDPAELDEAFAPMSEHVRESTKLLGRDHRWPMYDRLPINTWARGRVALMGDAAHPMLQYLAQGACQAIQDAEALAAALTGSIDAENALATYQSVRAPHAARVQATARAWGEIWHVDGIARELRNELLRQRHPQDHRHITWLYGK